MTSGSPISHATILKVLQQIEKGGVSISYWDDRIVEHLRSLGLVQENDKFIALTAAGLQWLAQPEPPSDSGASA